MRSLFFGDISSDVVVLSGDEGHHAADVMRLRVDEEIDISNNAGEVARVQVTAVSKGRIEAHVLSRVSVPASTPRVVVAQALAKGSGMLEAIDLMVQVGVDAIIPWQAERSIAKIEGQAKQERFEASAMAAAKQARVPMVPSIEAVASPTDVIARFRDFDITAVLHEGAAHLLAPLEWATAKSVLLIIGPEGGLSEVELERFKAAGAMVTRLGSSVIRSANAGAVAATVVRAGSTWRRSE